MKEKGNIFFCGGEDERRRKRRKTFRGGKYIYCGGIEEGRGNGEKYLEKEMSPWWDEEQTTNKER